MSKNIKSILTAAVISCATLYAGLSYSADTAKPAEPPKPPYTRADAIDTIINPHEQINDEGEVLWGTCLVCHTKVPDLKKEKSIKDTSLFFADDLNKLCTNCHTVKKHPASEGINVSMSGMTAPNHLVAPPHNIYLNMRLSLKEVPTTLPLDPKDGKIFCATCHNPHERGVLAGKADFGADYNLRLRTMGLDICQYCHRK